MPVTLEETLFYDSDNYKKGMFTASTSGAVTFEKTFTFPDAGSTSVHVMAVGDNAGNTAGIAVDIGSVMTVSSSTSVGGPSASDNAATVTVTYPTPTTVKIIVTGAAGENISWRVFYELVRG